MQNKQESPAFNAEYIDQLLSGSSVGKAPEVPAEQPMEQPEKCRPTPKERPHKWILILTAVLAAFLVLSLSLPELVAAVGSNRWQSTAEEAYRELLSKSSYHYKLHVSLERAGEDRQEYHREGWTWRNDYLYITHIPTGTVSYDLARNKHHYSKEVTAEDPNALWDYNGSSIDTGFTHSGTLAERNYTFHSIRGTLSGVEITYLKTKPLETRLTLKFDWDGTLTGITVFRSSDSMPYRKDEYALLQTDSEEIRDKIKEAFNEATKE